MAGPRSWNRREFNVAPTGWFTVLKPTGWFSATSHLPGGSRYLSDVLKQNAAKATSTAELDGFDRAGNHGAMITPMILAPSAREHGPMRQMLVVLGACAAAWLLLWWLIESQIF